MSDIEIGVRRADQADAQSLSALATHVFFETYATSGISLELVREAQAQFSVPAFASRLGASGTRTLVAERSAHLIALAEVTLNTNHALVSAAPSAELGHLYVQSPFIRKGVGRRLLRAAESIALAEGASTLWLTAWVGNARALTFYASQGYEQLGVTEYTFEGQSFENRLFAKKLGPET